VAWIGDDVWFVADEGMPRGLYRMNVKTRAVTQRKNLHEFVRGASLSADGARLAILAESHSTLPEVYLADASGGEARRVTDATRRVEAWPLGTREVVEWQASDGLRIEGVLAKPDGFDPTRQYPLLVVVHGGPRALDRPRLVYGGAYPIERWLARGALVLLPNYRGSAGYGPDFRTAHHRTAGPGDAMDVEAGVDHLIQLGIVDPERVAVMGWSYGGFVAAWLTATSDRFRAISVGAGISDWRTHYAWEAANITTRVFTFGTTPWEDPETWAASSPITHIAGARTPTLIQHIVGDPVVSILSAYELYQALVDLGVETELVQFPGAGHYPGNPKSQLALVWQNWEWFARHLWGRQETRDEVVGEVNKP
jgi:dipeptidyl aminopeptidase/acylaminoacyl peptidase